MEETMKIARENGYVETLWGRRRYVQGINSGNWRIRAATERETINMPIQGTAADIMRKAMVEVYKWILDSPKDVGLLLQIHDELVLECDEKDVKSVSKEICEIMNKVIDMKVPLEVDVEVGDILSQ